MIPTNSVGVAGIIDYNGAELITTESEFSLMRGRIFRFAYHKTVAAGADLTLVFDPSANTEKIGGFFDATMSVVSTAAPVAGEYFEGAVLTAPGTEITLYNLNRNDECDSSLNAVAKLYHTPTIDSSGNKYAPDSYLFASSSTLGQLTITASGSLSNLTAYLNPNKKYVWKLKNIGEASTEIAVTGTIRHSPEYRAGGR